MPRHSTLVIVLSGPIGVGKTSLAEALTRSGATHLSTSALLAGSGLAQRTRLQQLGATPRFKGGDRICEAIAEHCAVTALTVDCV
ncbi:hypothetical protein ACFQ07_14880, partial [Actinomadura adrarensis]